MDLSNTFNDAAQGRDAPDGVTQGDLPRGPNGPDRAAGSTISMDETSSRLSSDFSRTYQLWQEPDLEEIEIDREENARSGGAQANLDRLEAGRATHDAHNRLRPAPRTEQAVHTEIERQRECQIAALKEFIENNPFSERHVQGYGLDNDLELSL